MAYSDSWRTAFGSPFSASSSAGYWSLFNKRKRPMMSPSPASHGGFVFPKEVNNMVDYPGGGFVPAAGSFTSHDKNDRIINFMRRTQREAPTDVAPMIPVPNEPFDPPQSEGNSPDWKNKAAWEALSELQFGQETFSSLGKAGGRGGGPYKVAQHNIVQDITPSQGVFDPERKKRSWNLMMRGMV